MRKLLFSQKVMRPRRMTHRLAVLSSEEILAGGGGGGGEAKAVVVSRRRSSTSTTSTTTPDSDVTIEDSVSQTKPKRKSRSRLAGASTSHFSSTPPPPATTTTTTTTTTAVVDNSCTTSTTTTADSTSTSTSTTSTSTTSSSSSVVSFTIYGDPVALSRHRVTSRGIMYNPSAKLQKDFLDACQPFLPSQPLDGPLDASIVFFINRPKSHYGTGKNAGVLKTEIERFHSKKPDVDNLGKFVLDALNKAAYLDDSQVVALKVVKLYADDGPSRISVMLKSVQSVSVALADQLLR
eukprot:scaffold6243_cov180-Ochromonas_danica.AAC.3